MSRRERDWMTIMLGIKRQELTLVQAAELMDVSYRHSKRVWRRYRADGDAGAGAPVAGPAQSPAAQSAGTAGGRAGPLRRALRGLRSDAGRAEYLALDDTFKKAPESKKKQRRQTELGV
jgi:hypothetical protein